MLHRNKSEKFSAAGFSEEIEFTGCSKYRLALNSAPPKCFVNAFSHFGFAVAVNYQIEIFLGDYRRLTSPNRSVGRISCTTGNLSI